MITSSTSPEWPAIVITSGLNARRLLIAVTSPEARDAFCTDNVVVASAFTSVTPAVFVTQFLVPVSTVALKPLLFVIVPTVKEEDFAKIASRLGVV
jgi:hypothetical protein